MADLKQSPAWRQLRECLTRLQTGPWKFIQLRGATPGDEAIDGDDVDLLGRRASVDQLLTAAFGWARAGECHLRIRSASSAKVAFSLFSYDGLHRVDFDLWIALWQLNDRTRCLRYEMGTPKVTNPSDALQRLPVSLEAAIYVQHLISKRKDLSAAKVAQRLGDYVARCRAATDDKLADALERIGSQRTIDDTARMLVERIVVEQLSIPDPGNWQRKLRKLRDGFRTAWFAPPHKLSILSLMGCDGSGKTTMAETLAARRPDIEGVLTGKHLYRKSWFYKLLVIFIRPLLLQDRENFDETFAPVAYLRACLGLRFKLWRRARGVLLMDRSLADFLFVGRKTEHPQFARSRWLMKYFGRRIPTVHFVLPFERVHERKQEVTRIGHETYDTEMFRHFTSQSPVDYVLFNNARDLASSVAALDRILDSLNQR